MYLLFVYMIGCISGGIVEIIYQITNRGYFKIGGFLYGPIRPIYGLGCLILFFIGSKFKKNPFITFLVSMLICSAFEYISSFVLELLFNHSWWNYSNFIFNLNGRICLIISIGWGVLGLFFINIIEPLIKLLYSKLNPKLIKSTLIIFYSLYVIDTIFSFIRNFNL